MVCMKIQHAFTLDHFSKFRKEMTKITKKVKYNSYSPVMKNEKFPRFLFFIGPG